MELSGYALLMSLVTGAGIWPTVRAVWDSILDAGTAPELARQLTAVLTLQENVFALTSGGVGRTSRQMELTHASSRPEASWVRRTCGASRALSRTTTRSSQPSHRMA